MGEGGAKLSAQARQHGSVMYCISRERSAGSERLWSLCRGPVGRIPLRLGFLVAWCCRSVMRGFYTPEGGTKAQGHIWGGGGAVRGLDYRCMGPVQSEATNRLGLVWGFVGMAWERAAVTASRADC